jgi:hypothetical protein
MRYDTDQPGFYITSISCGIGFGVLTVNIGRSWTEALVGLGLGVVATYVQYWGA